MPSRRPTFPNPVAIFPRSSLLFTVLPDDALAALGAYTPGIPFASPFALPHDVKSVLLLSVDGLDGFRYVPFAADHGPLNINVVVKFCRLVGEVMKDPSTKGYPICLFSSEDPEEKSNAACLAACFALLTSRAKPWDIYEPLSRMEIMPFRDAGRGQSEWSMTVQDVLWGLWRAREYGLLDLSAFDTAEYEFYEQPSNGDLNVLGPFIAFASPIVPFKPRTLNGSPRADQRARKPNPALEKVLSYFEEHDVGVVVRLNEQLYDRRLFLEAGMEHVEMFFPDGSNPSSDIIREFITLADRTIKKGKKVAVHCKAGLGRTGVLIGAYLIYKHGFSASEVVAYMRMIRPGMVVGPQQVFMQVHFAEWIRWHAVDEYIRLQAKPMMSLSRIATRIATPGGPKTPHHRVEPDEGDGTPSPVGPLTPDKALQLVDRELSHLKTPGQPRKTPAINRTTRAYTTAEPDLAGQQSSPETEEELEVPTAKRSRPPTRIPNLMSPVQRNTLLMSPTGKVGLVAEKPSPSKKGKPIAVVSRPLPRRGALQQLAGEPQLSPTRSSPRKTSSAELARTPRTKLEMKPASDLFSPSAI